MKELEYLYCVVLFCVALIIYFDVNKINKMMC